MRPNKDFLDQAEKVIRSVLTPFRPELLKLYGNVEFETKYDNTVVTAMDRTIEEKLREALKAFDPGIGILGEEMGREGNEDTYWLLDPIDGTEQFVRGIPACKHLLGLIHDGEPVWAMMDFFARDELWTVRKDEGAYCNGQRTEMKHRPLKRAWFDLAVDLRDPEVLRRVAAVRPHVANLVSMRDAANVVSGRIDGVIALGAGGGVWDYAPRALFYTEAGGRIANIGSDTYDFTNNDFLVAHRDNFDELMKLLIA